MLLTGIFCCGIIIEELFAELAPSLFTNPRPMVNEILHKGSEAHPLLSYILTLAFWFKQGGIYGS